MAETRLQQLLQFYKEDPSDPFAIYGLALEYQKSDITESERFFDLLLGSFPDYLPAYYHAAKLKTSLGLNDEALKIYKKGIALAERANDKKTLQELKNAHNELEFEMQ